MSVREAVLSVAEGEIRNRIFVTPDIPQKKLANARSEFVKRNDEVLILVDDTVFGSGKDGLAITEQYIYAKQLFEIPKSIKISSIRSLEYESKRVNLDIYINNNLFLTLSSLERHDHDYLMAILQAAKEAATEGSLEPNQKEGSPDIVEQDESSQLSCDECNAELPPNAKFCLECGAKVLPKGVCLACDVKLPENAKFCPECGTPAGKQSEATAPTAAATSPQIDTDQARNELSELLANAEQDVSIDSDGDLRIYFTTRGVPSFASKLRASAMSYSIKVVSEGEVAEDDSLSVNFGSDDDSISLGGPYLRVGKLPSAQYEAQIDASLWATTTVEIHEVELKAGKIDAPALGSSRISVSSLKATKDDSDGSYGVEYELKAYPNHYVHFEILSEKPEEDVNLWPNLDSDESRSGFSWLYDVKPGATIYVVFAEYEKIVDGITATLSGTAEPMEGAYDEADDGAESSTPVMEVSLRDVEGDEHIYWVEMGGLPSGEDEVDWAIEKARAYHAQHVGTEPAEEDEDDLPVTAYEPFDRSESEYILVRSSASAHAQSSGGSGGPGRIQVELFFKGVIATEIEDGDGNYFDNSQDDFEKHKLKGTEALDADALTQFVKDNLKVVWDGTLDNPDDFRSYNINRVEGPILADYDGGLNLRNLSVFVDVEINLDNPDDVDFDDLFHAIVFQLSDGDMTITFTEFESYHSTWDRADSTSGGFVTFEAAIKWGAVTEDFSFDELPDEFAQAKELQKQGDDSCLDILLPFVRCVFMPTNLFGDVEEVFDLSEQDDEEIAADRIIISRLDFTDSNIPKIKASAFFNMKMNPEFDIDNLDEWQDENDMFDNAVSFEWNIETIDEDADVRSLSHEGLSMAVAVGDGSDGMASGSQANGECNSNQIMNFELKVVYWNADTGHCDEQLISLSTDDEKIQFLGAVCLSRPTPQSFEQLFRAMYDNPTMDGAQKGALYDEIWPIMSWWAFDKLGWHDVTVNVTGLKIDNEDTKLEKLLATGMVDDSDWALQLTREGYMYCYA